MRKLFFESACSSWCIVAEDIAVLVIISMFFKVLQSRVMLASVQHRCCDKRSIPRFSRTFRATSPLLYCGSEAGRQTETGIQVSERARAVWARQWLRSSYTESPRQVQLEMRDQMERISVVVAMCKRCYKSFFFESRYGVTVEVAHRRVGQPLCHPAVGVS